MIGATGAKSFKEAVRMTAEVRPPLKSRIREIRVGIGVKTRRGCEYLRTLRADEEARINPYYSESLRHACACAAGACLRTRFVLKPSVSLSLVPYARAHTQCMRTRVTRMLQSKSVCVAACRCALKRACCSACGCLVCCSACGCLVCCSACCRGLRHRTTQLNTRAKPHTYLECVRIALLECATSSSALQQGHALVLNIRC